MFGSTSHSIEIEVTPKYLPEQSNPGKSRYLFTYEVTIRNQTDDAVQLLSRHWFIQDGMGRIEEVEGPGVVGVQPVIEPGQSFTYSSFCPLPTPTGSMRGHYVMRQIRGGVFEVEIPLFILAEPSHYH